MILRAEQSFTLAFKGGQESALRFVRSPLQALSRARFLRELQQENGMLSGQLVVSAPGLGTIDLPFQSDLQFTPEGAELLPRALPQERAWVSVAGQARVERGTAPQGTAIHFAFQFEGHVTLPEVGGWGGAAFEKMVVAAAQRTLNRVTAALPQDVKNAMPDPPFGVAGES